MALMSSGGGVDGDQGGHVADVFDCADRPLLPARADKGELVGQEQPGHLRDQKSIAAAADPVRPDEDVRQAAGQHHFLTGDLAVDVTVADGPLRRLFRQVTLENAGTIHCHAAHQHEATDAGAFGFRRVRASPSAYADAGETNPLVRRLTFLRQELMARKHAYAGRGGGLQETATVGEIRHRRDPRLVTNDA